MLSLRFSLSMKYLASQSIISRNTLLLPNIGKFCTNTKANDALSFEDLEELEELTAREAEIEKKRNKSRLRPADYNKQHDQRPFEDNDFQKSLVYQRQLYGTYGNASGINPSILWPSKKELNYMKEYEAVIQPYKFHELVEQVQKKNELAREAKKEEKKKILAKAKNVEKEILAFHTRVAKEKEKAMALIEKKNKLIKEIKRHFGYDIDVRDEKFKEMLAKKELEEKKQKRAAKKAKMLEMKETNEREILKTMEAESTQKEE